MLTSADRSAYDAHALQPLLQMIIFFSTVAMCMPTRVWSIHLHFNYAHVHQQCLYNHYYSACRLHECILHDRVNVSSKFVLTMAHCPVQHCAKQHKVRIEQVTFYTCQNQLFTA